MDGVTNSMYMSLSKLWDMVKDREGWHAAAHGIAESDMTYQLNNNSKATIFQLKKKKKKKVVAGARACWSLSLNQGRAPRAPESSCSSWCFGEESQGCSNENN